MRLALLLALPFSLIAEVPCLDGLGPLQDGQWRCGELYPTSNSKLTIQKLSITPVESYYGLYITSETDDPSKEPIEQCLAAVDCALVVVMDRGKEIARLTNKGEWIIADGVDPSYVARVFMAAMMGYR